MTKFTPKLALALANSTSHLARRSGKWGGTTLPGKVALKLWPEATAELSAKLKSGCVLLSGTNGKTTTARILAGCAAADGIAVCSNSAGANLTSGVTSALLPLAKKQPVGELGVFEVDEAALAEVAAQTRPKLMVLMNLFRDQLDRHGELETLLSRWQAMIAKLSPETLLLVNADDPGLVAITESRGSFSAETASNSPENVFYYGLSDASIDRGLLPHAADTNRCRHCQAKLSYSCHTIGHLGDWFCPNCHWQRPQLDFAAGDISLRDNSFTLSGGKAAGDLRLALSSPLTGLHNVYNCLAAVSAAHLLGISDRAAEQALQAAKPVFGRGEEVLLEGKKLHIFLAKNPTGTNENIHTIQRFNQPATLLIALNDRIADGHDVSWIWDVDYEPLFEIADRIVFSGDRAHEMALRYRYRFTDAENPTTKTTTTKTAVLPQLPQALDWTLATTPQDGLIVALLTYTATLELRSELGSRGAVEPFWEQK